MTEITYYELTIQLYDELTDIIDAGKVINAIKHLRKNGADSLKEAKKVCDVIRYCRDDIIITNDLVLVPEIDVFADTEKRKRDYVKVKNYMM